MFLAHKIKFTIPSQNQMKKFWHVHVQGLADVTDALMSTMSFEHERVENIVRKREMLVKLLLIKFKIL